MPRRFSATPGTEKHMLASPRRKTEYQRCLAATLDHRIPRTPRRQYFCRLLRTKLDFSPVARRNFSNAYHTATTIGARTTFRLTNIL